MGKRGERAGQLLVLVSCPEELLRRLAVRERYEDGLSRKGRGRSGRSAWMPVRAMIRVVLSAVEQRGVWMDAPWVARGIL